MATSSAPPPDSDVPRDVAAVPAVAQQAWAAGRSGPEAAGPPWGHPPIIKAVFAPLAVSRSRADNHKHPADRKRALSLTPSLPSRSNPFAAFFCEEHMRRTSVVLLLMVAAACKAKQPVSQADSAASATATATATATAIGEVPVTSTESPIAPEVHPPGDIPDTQAFVPYSSASGGYSIEVPEGWARSGDGSSVTFASKLDGLRVDVVPATSPPTVASAATEAKQIQAQGRAVNITSTSDVSLPSGRAVLIKYESNSDPNSVTPKQVRLDNEAYVLFKNGKQAIVTLWAPKGADNADQWHRMSRSFRWQ